MLHRLIRIVRYELLKTVSVLVVMLHALESHCVAQNVTVTWQGQQLGIAFERLADAASLPVWLDRRVDPTQLVEEKFADVPVREAFSRLAGNHGLGVLDLGELVYVGPQRTSQGLASLLLEARGAAKRSSAGYRTQWLQANSMAWPRLAEPRTLLETSLSSVGIAIEDAGLVPHDLWPAREYPQLSLVDQTVLILVGFDLRCEITHGGRNCRVVPIEYPLPDRTEELRVKSSKRDRPAKQTKTRSQFSLKLTNQPVGRVIEQLGAQLKLKVVWDQNSLNQYSRSQKTLTSCAVKNADLEGLLTAILQPAGMDFTLEEKRLTIRGAP